MSYDLNLSTVCNHKIFRELVILERDRRSIRMARPLASASNLKLYASNDLIPKTMYDIIYDSNSQTLKQARMVYFKQKWRSYNDYFEVTYITTKENCSKCMGRTTLDDISYNVRGELYLNRNESLLLQNMEKFTVTEIESNPFHEFIGTSLVSLLGEKVSDPDFLTNKIIQEINQTLNKFSDLQNQYKQAGRTLTDGEQLESIDNVQVLFDEDDPTILRSDITVSAKSGKSVTFSQYLQLPQF